ncbi:MAG: hypothetical protein SOZ23_04825 [Methanosphaera sp.]|uniref:hypothetical protein n=1 Tax=Methanosphaera sp. TaxID=2666342 RepID=UPI0025E71732|nr:hypothetical protein [Methanosphaera sp.]MCI5867623.1 hypothetical protein [Methanosphaera sp.]MDY3956100.1 hypothetical protein [Methanosphaera sp.]
MSDENIFKDEKQLFELTDDIDFTQLNKKQQRELKDQISPKNYNLFVYDTHMDDEIFETYMVGSYLYNPCDVYGVGCLTNQLKNTRFYILSKEFQEIPKEHLVDEHKNMNLAVSGILNCFKILDITKTEDDKRQLLLLHYNSFEELALNHKKTPIEKKAQSILDEKLQTLPKVDDEIDLDELNYKITTAIGINKTESGYELFSKDQIIFYLEVLSEIVEKYDIDMVFEFTDKYDIGYIINVYENSIEDIKDDENYKENKEKIIKTYINTILNSLEVSENLGNNETMGIFDDFDVKSDSEKLKEVSDMLDIDEDKLKELIDPK